MGHAFVVGSWMSGDAATWAVSFVSTSVSPACLFSVETTCLDHAGGHVSGLSVVPVSVSSASCCGPGSFPDWVVASGSGAVVLNSGPTGHFAV